jgi:hypothetical protein
MRVLRTKAFKRWPFLLVSSYKSCRYRSVILQLLLTAWHLTDLNCTCYGISICHGCLPNGRTANPSLHTRCPIRSPESRCFLRLSYLDAIHTLSRRLDFSREPSASPKPAELHSASAASDRLTLQLLLSPVSTIGRGRRCRTTFLPQARRWQLANGRWSQLREKDEARGGSRVSSRV